MSTNECHVQAWKQLALEQGVPFNDDIYRRMAGMKRMDSLRVLLLTIYPEYHLFDTVVAVDSFLWVNGQVYTVSGVYDFDTLTVPGCDSLLTLVLTITHDTTDIEDLSILNSQLSIFPNPTDGSVTLSSGEVDRTLLYDLSGRSVASWKEKREMDLRELPAGVYLLRVVMKNGSSGVFRIVKR